MSIKRSKVWLVLGLQVALAAAAQAQELPDYEWVPGVRDFQPFAPASDVTSSYGRGVNRRKRGWFFTIEDLGWTTSSPERTTIGNANFTPLVSYDGQGYFQQQNTLDTGFIQPGMQNGERIQLGYVGDDDVGWMVGYFWLHSRTDTAAASNAGMSFASPFIPGVPGNETEGFIDNYVNGASVFGNGFLAADVDVNKNGIHGQDGRLVPVPGVPGAFTLQSAPVDYGDLIQLPIEFSEIRTKYASRAWSIEVMRTWGLSKSRRADHGIWDFMAGVRYLRFRDSLFVDAEGYSQSATLNANTGFVTVTGQAKQIQGILADTQFNQTADNNLVGPQIALRWQKQRGRLAMSVSGRFAPMANFQNARQTGDIADRSNSASLNSVFVRQPIDNNLVLAGKTVATGALPILQYDTPFLHSTSVNHTRHSTQFSPLGELRIDAKYQIFRNVYATVGWTGIVMGGIARSPNMINYSLPAMGILNTGNRQVLFLEGINFGITVNR
ncbi:MAG TPA: BBP7 family outer membrane beta-barrel protein [Pirellulales bacterium]